MVETLIKHSPNGTAPTGYLHVRSYEWVACDLPAYAGFRAHVYANPTYGEERAERRLWADVNTPEGEEAWLQHCAPFVVRWNALAADEAGAIVEIPPPAEAGWEIFYALERDLLGWLMWQVHLLPRGKARPSASPSSEPVGPTPAPSSEDSGPS